MPKVVCIVQARMGSTRLPGKSLRDLGGTTLVESVYAGASMAKSLSEVIFAIPESRTDDELFDFLRSKGLNVVRGSESDLISRHLHVASRVNADFIVRIPGDNPLPHGSEIDRIVDFHLQSNPDGFSTNLSEIFNSGYPDGIGAEIFSRQVLEEIYASKTYASSGCGSSYSASDASGEIRILIWIIKLFQQCRKIFLQLV